MRQSPQPLLRVLKEEGGVKSRCRRFKKTLVNFRAEYLKPLCGFLSRPQKYLICKHSGSTNGAPRLRPNSIGCLRQ
ncbi:hypothetical protein TNCV_1495941 [Trichonephila clavipes]|nr:hypothetical protein TNCV_1495941 [Trichonephila clavipes]